MKFTPPTYKQLIINCLGILTRPITGQLAYFVLLYVLLTIPDIYYLAFHSFLPISRSLLGLFLVYILSLPVIFLPSSFRRYYKNALVVFAVFLFIVNIYLLLLYNETFETINKDALSAILATNPEESVEYIKVYFTIDKLFSVSVFISAVFLLYYCLRKLSFRWNNIGRLLVLVLLLTSTLVSFKQLYKIKEGNWYFMLTNKCPDLCDYMQNPEVVCDDDVNNVVLVIGESFTKFHSSLYEYEKMTNPLLGKLKSDSSLLVYENITSACVTTIPSMKSIIMSYTDSMSDSIEWYRCLTLIEVMQKTGYKTYWLSNQSKTGIYDNEVGRFADLCDEQVFIGDKHSGLRRANKDEELLPVLEKCMHDSCCSKFIILHLMGSHADYAQRYPIEYSKFKAEDYALSHPHLPEESRTMLSEYDNSVLYNDWVINEVVRKFENTDAVVVYFSDHGEDVYRSSDVFCGHATKLDENHKSVVQQIPFMVYTSPLFREKHSELQQRIESAVSRPYRTDSVMYTIMDVAGVETVNGVSYKHKSLFK